MYSPRIDLEPTIVLQSWVWAVAAVLVAVQFVLTRKRPDWGLAMVVAATPLYMARGTLGIPTTLLELLLLSTFGALATRWREFQWLRSRYLVWLGIWVGGALLAAFAHPANLREGLGLWRAFFLEPALWLVAALGVYKGRSRIPLLWGALGALAVITVWSVHQIDCGCGFTYDDRLRGSFQSPNALAQAVVPLGLLAAFWPSKRLIGIRIAATAAVVIMVIASNSRGGELALAAGVVVGLMYLRGRVLRYAVIGVTIGAVLAAAVFGPRLIKHQENQVVSARPVIWGVATDVISSKPILGNGPNQFQSTFKTHEADKPDNILYIEPQAVSAHNVFLSTWLDWGLLTLVGFLGLLAMAVRNLWSRRIELAAPAAMLTAIVVHGLVDTTVLKNDLAIYFMLGLVLAQLGREETV